MNLVESLPIDPYVAGYVDRYQLFEVNEPAYLKTVPNGKIECYLIKEGHFERWDNTRNEFVSSGESGFLPASKATSLYAIPGRLLCLNIKFNLNVLELSFFDGFLTNWNDRQITELFGSAWTLLLDAVDFTAKQLDVVLLDEQIHHAFSGMARDTQLSDAIHLIEHEQGDTIRLDDLADQLNMTRKTLERWIKKHFNLTPKELVQVLRFESTTAHLKSNASQRMIEALQFGYYDQSHFIKECKKITGYAPKEFFSKLKLSTNDIIIENQ